MAELSPDPDGPDAAFAAELAALRQAYLRALPGKVEALGLALAEQRRAAVAGAGPALGLAHRLAGTAGSYGCAALGEVARRIEHALEGLPTADDPAAAWAGIETALAQARGEAQAAARAASRP